MKYGQVLIGLGAGVLVGRLLFGGNKSQPETQRIPVTTTGTIPRTVPTSVMQKRPAPRPALRPTPIDTTTSYSPSTTFKGGFPVQVSKAPRTNTAYSTALIQPKTLRDCGWY